MPALDCRRGRARGPDDLWPVLYAIPTRDQQILGQDTLRDLLRDSDNATLPAAAEESSAGPLARARRINAAGQALLSALPATDGMAWRLQLEGVAREIDASFSPSNLPPELAALRLRIVEGLAAS